MARERKKSPTGKIGTVVIYELNGQDVMRSLPRRYKQTPGTKASSGIFGRAAKLGACIRSALYPLLPSPKDNNMQTRLSGQLYKFLKCREKFLGEDDIPLLSDFHFNSEATLKTSFRKLIQVDQIKKDHLRLTLSSFIPTNLLKAPAATKSIECKIVAVSVSLNKDFDDQAGNYFIVFPFTDKQVPAQEFDFKISTASSRLVLIAIRLTPEIIKKRISIKSNESKYLPCDIVYAKQFS